MVTGVQNKRRKNPDSNRIRVLVADDSRVALNSVCKYLEIEEQFEIVGTAYDGVRLLELAEQLRPDLVLADLSMPQINGLEAARELRRLYPELRLLIYSGLHGLSIRDECQRSGADGFVEKSQMPQKLMEEVRRLFPHRV